MALFLASLLATDAWTQDPEASKIKTDCSVASQLELNERLVAYPGNCVDGVPYIEFAYAVEMKNLSLTTPTVALWLDDMSEIRQVHRESCDLGDNLRRNHEKAGAGFGMMQFETVLLVLDTSLQSLLDKHQIVGVTATGPNPLPRTIVSVAAGATLHETITCQTAQPSRSPRPVEGTDA